MVALGMVNFYLTRKSRKNPVMMKLKYIIAMSLFLSNDPETLHEKDLGILQYVTHVVTTLRESLVLLDGGTELFG